MEDEGEGEGGRWGESGVDGDEDEGSVDVWMDELWV